MEGQPGVPDGTGVQAATGGPNIIKRLLSGLKKLGFTGQVRVKLDMGALLRTGHVVMRDGEIALAVHTTTSSGNEDTQVGLDALKRSWEDSYNPNSIIEVVPRENVEDLVSAYPDALIKPKARPAAQEPRVGLSWGKDETSEIESKLSQYRKDGYDVSSLEAAREKGAEEAMAALVTFESGIPLLKAVETQLISLDGKGMDDDIAELRAILKDPLRGKEAERKLAYLREKLSERAKGAALIVEEKGAKAPAHGEVVPDLVKCEVCGKMIKGGAPCPTCGNVPSSIKSAEPAPKPETGLKPDFTFDRFIVGDSNRLAHQSAMAVVTRYHPKYNPLFIYSGSGLGKTHLLNAIGNSYLRKDPGKSILYIPSSDFIELFTRAIKEGSVEQFRKSFTGIDMLILDDAQFLAQTEAVQEELFHIFNDMIAAERQVIFASDRPPKEMAGVTERLLSRFSSGLTIDIQPPDLETRVAILAQRAEEMELRLDPDVLRKVATLIPRSIRKIEGALAKLSMYAQLPNTQITVDSVTEMLKDDIESAEEMRRAPIPPQKGALRNSHSYLVEENKPATCFALFADLVAKGYKGLVITRTKPQRLMENYSFAAKILWLTDRESATEEVIGPSLEKLIYKIDEVINSGENTALLIDGLEYLISSNNFDAVLRFLRRLIDEVAELKCVFMLSLAPGTLGEHEQKTLERELEIITG
ncbi:MAG: DUF835 domain-containing protein [Euryarchaeota archaeon]|nr:DUF835 domain-containing protein [Euryarchaeota archaeon]